MPAKRYPPDDPREWLNRAKSSLAKAKSGLDTPDVYLEDLCFDAQQAAEKAIKAVLIQMKVRFPYVHDLALLLTLTTQTGQNISETVMQAAILSDYAVETRYPGLAEPVTLAEYQQAIAIAEEVVLWAEKIIRQSVDPAAGAKD